jgi:predicted P-loop ATPase
MEFESGKEDAPAAETGARGWGSSTTGDDMPRDIIADNVSKRKGISALEDAGWGSVNRDYEDYCPITPGAEPTHQWDYLDEKGDYCFSKLRYKIPTEPFKTFRMKRQNLMSFKDRQIAAERDPEAMKDWLPGRGDHPDMLYRLPELVGSAEGERILVVEGEKDVETARALGFVATCNADGARKFPDSARVHLRGRQVYLIPDNDPSGEQHVQLWAGSLAGDATVKVVKLPGLGEKEDLTDWVEKRRDDGQPDEKIASALSELLEVAPPPAQVASRGGNRKVANVASFVDVLLSEPEFDGFVAYDEFANKMLLMKPVPGTTVPKSTFKPRDWRDTDYTSVQMWLQRHGYPTAAKNNVIDAVAVAAQENVISPVKHYLEDLKWDGTRRLDRMLEVYFGADVEDEEGDKPGAKATYVRAVSAAWPISAVARAIDPGQKADCMMVLEGAQGISKSTGLRVLTEGDHHPKFQKGWFNDSLDTFKGKDAMSNIVGSWIVEVGELAAMSRAEIRAVKQYLSSQSDKFRPAYGRTELDMKRRCVFAGTTNDTDYLRDPTGNRRFWPVRTSKIDLLGLKEDRDQLWAEAVHRYKAGEEWWLKGEAADYQKIATGERMVQDAWQPFLEQLSHVKSLTSHELLSVIGVPVEKRTPVDAKRARDVMVSAGWLPGNKVRARGPRRGQVPYHNPDPAAEVEATEEVLAAAREQSRDEQSL